MGFVLISLESNMKPKELKIREGKERNEYFRSLSDADKLASLNHRLGKDKGAKRQRGKLNVAN